MKLASAASTGGFGWLGLAALLAGACGCGSGDLPAPNRPIVIAHRGASGLAPEHTVAAYDRAVAIGADYLEQDLQITRDGVLVVLHDDTLDRTARGPVSDCTGPVRARTLAQLENCEFGAWFDERRPGAGERFAGQRILTLDAVFVYTQISAAIFIARSVISAADKSEESRNARAAANA